MVVGKGRMGGMVGKGRVWWKGKVECDGRER